MLHRDVAYRLQFTTDGHFSHWLQQRTPRRRKLELVEAAQRFPVQLCHFTLFQWQTAESSNRGNANEYLTGYLLSSSSINDPLAASRRSNLHVIWIWFSIWAAKKNDKFGRPESYQTYLRQNTVYIQQSLDLNKFVFHWVCWQPHCSACRLRYSIASVSLCY